MQSSEPAEAMYRTLAAHDPTKTVICVGGAAMAAQFYQAGAPIGPQADVDVLCSREYFAQKSVQAPSLSGFRTNIREPYGTSTRALSPVIDIYPIDRDDLLPFSASEALGGQFYPTYYDACLADKNNLVVIRGCLFLSVKKLLLWTAAAGRQKDIIKIDTMLPLALQYGLISAADYARIQHERDVSAELRAKHPQRYFARVE